MSGNLIRRVITSILLLLILFLCLFLNKYSWLLLIIVASIISFFEFINLIKKIRKRNKSTIYLANVICLFYLYFFILLTYQDGRIQIFNTLYVLSICMLTDIGGYVVGKLFGGKKLTKISPNKTISGCIGSFVFSLFSIISIIYYDKFYLKSFGFNLTSTDYLKNIFFILFISFICQAGDLFISYFKRKAKVKDTGIILPGHGGLLDRIDGIIFALPIAFILLKIFF